MIKSECQKSAMTAKTCCTKKQRERKRIFGDFVGMLHRATELFGLVLARTSPNNSVARCNIPTKSPKILFLSLCFFVQHVLAVIALFWHSLFITNLSFFLSVSLCNIKIVSKNIFSLLLSYFFTFVSLRNFTKCKKCFSASIFDFFFQL